MDLGIKGKVAVITGGDSGIGKATAKLLAYEGVKVTILDKTPENIELAAQELRKFGEIFPDIKRFNSWKSLNSRSE